MLPTEIRLMIWKRAKRLYARIHEVRHFPPYLHVIVSGGYNPLLAINREARDYVLETCMLMFNPRYFNARQSSCLFDYSIDTLYFNVNIFQGSEGQPPTHARVFQVFEDIFGPHVKEAKEKVRQVLGTISPISYC
jgi:hypothetical protein